jgi:hypothetical protein
MNAGRDRTKISPDQLVDEFLRGFSRNQREMNNGSEGCCDWCSASALAWLTVYYAIVDGSS